MAVLCSPVHRDAGPLATFTTWQDAVEELRDVLSDEPAWSGELWIEPFELVLGRGHQRACLKFRPG